MKIPTAATQLLARTVLVAGLVAVPSLPAFGADSKAAGYYEEGLTRYDRKDLRGAIIQLKNAIQADRKLLAAHVLLGKALLESGDPIGAEVEFDEALRLGVNRAEVITFLGQAYLLQGKFGTLLERVTPAGLPTPQQVAVLVLRANAQAEKDSIAVAISTLDEARLLDPASIPVRLAQATISMRKGDIPLARKLVDDALSVAPEDAGAWHTRGTLQQATGDQQAALVSYAKAAALNPRYLEPRITRAGLLVDLGRIDEAEQELASIKEKAPFEPRAAYYRALIAKSRGNKAATKAALEEVIRRLDPLPAEALISNKPMLMLSALAHYNLGNREKASERLASLLRRYPGDEAGTKLLARLHLDDGNHSSATLLLEPLRRRSPEDPRVLSLLATAYMQAGNHRQASELLDQAVRHSGGATDIRTDLGISLAGSGKEEQAIEQVRQAWLKDPKQTRSGMVLATLYLRTGQPKKALEVVDTLARNEPSNPAVLNMLGVTRVAAGDRAGGRQAYEQVLARTPTHPGAILNLSSLDQAEGKLDAARQRLLDLLKQDEKNIDAMMEIAAIEEKAKRFDEAARWLDKARIDPKAAVAAATRLAELHLRTGAVDKSLSVAREALSKAPGDLPALGLLARAQLAKGDSAAARRTLGDMARYAGYAPAAQVEVARLQVIAANDSGANYSLDKALGSQPGFLPALILRSEIEIRQRDFAKAEQRIKQIAEASGNDAVALRLQGDLAMARGQQAAALTAYGNALKKADNAEMALRLYRAQVATGGLAKGAAFLQKWQSGRADDVVILRTLGDAELQLGNLPAARTAYEKLLKVQPDDGLVWNNLAQVAFAQNQMDASGFAERAYNLRPHDPVVIDTLGWLLFRQGQVDRGLALLRDARLRNPNDPEIRYHLAAALASSGRKAEAREEISQALRSGKPFAGIEEARRLQSELAK